jgi:GDP-L-fucose synthase
MANIFDLTAKRIFVSGHKGMVGSAVLRQLAHEPCEIITATRKDVDLTRQDQVEKFIEKTQPDAIIMAAAKVGGIHANNTLPADFLYTNLMIESNITQAAYRSGVKRMLFLGSSCIYPKFAAQPITEDALLTGPLEPTNEWYAIAKIAGIKLTSAYRKQYGVDFISAMPTNLYGPNDNFDLMSSHVLPAILRKAHEAKLNNDSSIIIWGSGKARREFLHVDDCAKALLFLLKHYSDDEHINIGMDTDITILELTQLICDVVGFKGKIIHDLSKPDGTPRKLMSSTKIRSMGWTPSIDLRTGITTTYEWFLSQE